MKKFCTIGQKRKVNIQNPLLCLITYTTVKWYADFMNH